MDDDDELQQWLDEQDIEASRVAKEREIARKQYRMPNFEQMKYNFQVQLYAKAIGAE